MEKKKILIAGGTGLIGTRLSILLKKNNYEVNVLSRSGGGSSVQWNPDKRELDPALLENIYGIINLAGAGIADGRWTPARKQIIQQSRTAALETLYQALQPVKKRPSVFVSASAVGFYGDRGSELLTEQSIPGDGFLPETVILWEKAAAPISDYGIRTVLYRIGVVLAKEGGALPRMALPVKLGAGSPVGSGKQFVPFIHIDDLCKAFLFALENADIHGIYNVCAPQPVTNEKLTREIGRILRRPVFLPNVPAFVIKGLLGELSHLILDTGPAACSVTLMSFLRLTAEYRERNNSTAEEALETTVRRLLPLSAAATAVHLLHIILFLPGNPSGNSEAVWKQGILLSHPALAVWSLIILYYIIFII